MIGNVTVTEVPRDVRDLIRDGVSALVHHSHSQSFNAGWWHDQDKNSLIGDRFVIGTKLMLTVSELSEAMEGFRKNLMDDKLPSRSMVEVELADAMIRIADLAGSLKLDLAGAILEKMAFNAIRPDHKVENRAKADGKKF